MTKHSHTNKRTPQFEVTAFTPSELLCFSYIDKLLKENLGSQFIGGLIRSDYAKNCPKYVTSLPTDPMAFTKSVNTAQVVVYIRGIRDSPAWKIGEYLAAGKCIVAELLDTILPTALRDNEEVS